ENGLAAPLQLARNRFGLIDEKDHDVNGWMAEMDAEGRAVELASQFVHLVDEKLQTLHLHGCTGKPVDNNAVAILRAQEFAEQETHDLTILGEVSRDLHRLRFRRVKQCTDNDW